MRQIGHPCPPGRASRRGPVVLAVALAMAAPAAIARQDPGATPAGPSEEAKGKWIALFRRQAGAYVISSGANGGAEARRLPDPVLRWWQPVRGTDDGALFLWTRDGRPVAAGAIFTIKDASGHRDLVHEFHSLALAPVVASWRGQPAWDSPVPGIDLQPIPGAPAPAASAPARLRQMQGLVRDFDANSVDARGSRWQLRALAKPLYRYEGTGPETLDGALFAFAQGTDPEILLVVEARPRGAGHEWRYALAAFTDLELRVRHQGREVWSIPEPVVKEARSGPHVGFIVERRAGDDPEAFVTP